MLVLDSRLAGMAETLAKAPAGMPVYVASRAVMDAVAGFPMHRGVLAIGRTARRRDAATACLPPCPRRALVVVLVGISNHDNMGAIFRNAAAFGADAVLLDETCCDPLYRKAIRVSVGAALKVPFAICRSGRRLVADARPRTASARSRCRRAARPISATLERRERLALYLGTEGEGLPAEPAGAAAKRCASRWRKVSTASTSPPPRRSRCTRSGTE